LEFYLEASLNPNRISVVWSNLKEHKYNNDLSKFDDEEEEKLDVKALPRYLLASNQEFFNSLFQLLDFGGNL